MTTSLRSSIAESASLLAPWGFGAAPAPPKRSQERSPPIRRWQNESDADRGAPGRMLSVARLGGWQRVLLHLTRYSNLQHKTGHSSIGPKAVLFSSVLFNYEKYYSFAFLVKTGPKHIFSVLFIDGKAQKWNDCLESSNTIEIGLVLQDQTPAAANRIQTSIERPCTATTVAAPPGVGKGGPVLAAPSGVGCLGSGAHANQESFKTQDARLIRLFGLFAESIYPFLQIVQCKTEYPLLIQMHMG